MPKADPSSGRRRGGSANVILFLSSREASGVNGAHPDHRAHVGGSRWTSSSSSSSTCCSRSSRVGFNASYGIWLARARDAPQATQSHVLRTIKFLDDRIANPAYGLLLLTGC